MGRLAFNDGKVAFRVMVQSLDDEIEKEGSTPASSAKVEHDRITPAGQVVPD